MVSDFDDEELLDFLMTSDFDDEYKEEEVKYLLKKWRYFYRILFGKFENCKKDKTFLVEKFNKELRSTEKELTMVQVDKVKISEKLENIKNKKLSIKERITGKLKKDDESRRVQ